MNNLVKGALLNALVFPGLGQLAQKNKVRGWLYITATIICLVVVVRVIFATVGAVLAKTPDDKLSANVAVLTDQVTSELLFNGGASANYAVIAFICIWVIALLDAITTGIAQNRQSKVQAK